MRCSAVQRGAVRCSYLLPFDSDFFGIARDWTKALHL
jgi:hypothetical protein